MKEDRILLSHGSGGKMSQALTERIFLKYFDDPALIVLNDQAILDVPGGRIAFSTDTYTIDPIFFPGGDIGSLSIHGTINDVVMSGAVPFALSAGFVLEEGFPITDLEKIVRSMSDAAREAGVRIVTGDTKVVTRGAADKIFINTTGIGILRDDLEISGDRARPGDRIIVSGTIGEHGIAIVSSRDGIDFSKPVCSDSAPLSSLVELLIKRVGGGVHAMRDPTRGGLATVLSEIASQSSVGVIIEEQAIPVKGSVRGACEILGYDPLYLANEGKLVIFVDEMSAGEALNSVRSHPLGREASIIGRAVEQHPGKVVMRTIMGGRRVIDRLVGEMLPRIC